MRHNPGGGLTELLQLDAAGRGGGTGGLPGSPGRRNRGRGSGLAVWGEYGRRDRRSLGSRACRAEPRNLTDGAGPRRGIGERWDQRERPLRLAGGNERMIGDGRTTETERWNRYLPRPPAPRAAGEVPASRGARAPLPVQSRMLRLRLDPASRP